MIKYFRKRKNFNRIKKLIETNPVRFEGTFKQYPNRSINKYFCENIIITLTCWLYQNYAKDYIIESENKKIDLNENQIEILYELAEEKHRKPYWLK